MDLIAFETEKEFKTFKEIFPRINSDLRKTSKFNPFVFRAKFSMLWGGRV